MTRVEGVDVPIKKFTFGHLKKQIWPNNNEANKLSDVDRRCHKKDFGGNS
uniref:Uncharacterized protein n=1 Tax=Rhizophagus irregularis (strain DAOM 181602 / DAOM 197198 / MUCL 43194) TaxID=747089 RepID=U9TPU4_RHIID